MRARARRTGDEDLADLEGRRGVLVLGDVGDDGLGDGLAEGVELARVATTRDAEADVHAREGRRERGRRRGERLEEEDRLVELATENGRAVEAERDTVDLDEALALLRARARRGEGQRSTRPTRTGWDRTRSAAAGPRTLAKATAVAVFFLPKVWTD